MKEITCKRCLGCSLSIGHQGECLARPDHIDLPDTLWLLRVTQGPGGGWVPGNWVHTINGFSLDFVGVPFASRLGPPTAYTKDTIASVAAMVWERHRAKVDFVPFREVRLNAPERVVP